jgi:spoIIIJ-associated protein
VAHAEASARTVEAAVTAAAAQLGLRSDQVDVEVLQDPVPSTFGYIGTPARVRATPRQPASPSADARDAARDSALDAPVAATSPQPSDATRVAAGGQPSDTPGVAGSGQPSEVVGVAGPGQPSGVRGIATGQPSDAIGGAAVGRPPDAAQVADPAARSDPTRAVPPQASSSARRSNPAQSPGAAQVPGAAPGSDPGQASGPTQDPPQSSVVGSPLIQPSAQGTNDANRASEANHQSLPEAAIHSPSSSAQVPHRPSPDPAWDSTRTDSASVDVGDLSGPVATQTPSSSTPPAPVAGPDESGHTGGAAGEPSATAPATSAPSAQPSSSIAAGGGNHGSGPEGTAAVSTAAAASDIEKTPPTPSVSERPNAPRPRRGFPDEPIEPELVEADTERAGDFLEGLLDALDVDGDITTWIDEAGGHIDLEGSDLDVLVGTNGETLDALQELTRIAVLRQSKRRVRLLLDVNGFRSRQRDRLVSVVKATAERVISSREEHEFEPMTPAERKVVHDAVAAIDGVQTESLGEEPYRRVVIRPT